MKHFKAIEWFEIKGVGFAAVLDNLDYNESRYKMSLSVGETISVDDDTYEIIGIEHYCTNPVSYGPQIAVIVK